MSIFNNISNYLFNRNLSIEKGKNGTWSYLFSSNLKQNNQNFLKQSICNPALFTVLDLRSTIFSQGKIIVEDVTDPDNPVNLPDDPFILLLNNPYLKTSRQDFLYKHLWYKSLGNNYTRKIKTSNDVYNINSIDGLYNLNPININWNCIDELDKFLITQDQKNRYNEQKLKYDFNGNIIDIELNEVIPFYDVTNAMLSDGELMQSPSRLTSLQGVLDNVMRNTEAKAINLNFAGKYLASNRTVDDGVTTPLDIEDKNEVENSLYQKNIIATNATVDVQPLAADFRRLMLGDLFAEDYFTIARAYNIPRDVAEAWLKSGSTFDNQEKSFVKWAQSSIQFEGDDFTNTYQTEFNYSQENKKIRMSWDHLPIMATVHKAKEQSYYEYTRSLIDLVKEGIISTQTAQEREKEYLNKTRS